MKFFSLLFCLGTLCITNASSSRLPKPHHLHRRQDGSEYDCATNLFTNTCNSGFYQSFANVLLECNEREAAEGTQKFCESSSSGTLCGPVDISSLARNIANACGSSPTTCSSDCQDLLTTTRAELGCCITFLNSPDSDEAAAAFNNSLWSLCNVELVTERCAPGPIELPAFDVNPNCDSSNILERLYDEAVCRTQYLESMQDIVVLCGFHPNFTLERCAVNEMGKYCDATENETRSLHDAASTHCSDTSMCDPLCIGTLESITSCCLITKYNGTSVRDKLDWLSYEFWSHCGLDSPGFCEFKLNDAPVDGSTVIIAPGIVPLITALMVIAQHYMY